MQHLQNGDQFVPNPVYYFFQTRDINILFDMAAYEVLLSMQSLFLIFKKYVSHINIFLVI